MPLFPDEFPFKRPTSQQTFAPPPPPAPVIPEPQVVAPPPEPAPVVARAVEEDPLPEIPPAVTNVAVDHERRRSPRQGLIARALVRNANANGPGWKVDLLNISMLGIRFRSTTSLLPGDMASVKLEVGPLRWSTKLRVVHAVQLDDGNYAIGCQFISNELLRAARRAA